MRPDDSEQASGGPGDTGISADRSAGASIGGQPPPPPAELWAHAAAAGAIDAGRAAVPSGAHQPLPFVAVQMAAVGVTAGAGEAVQGIAAGQSAGAAPGSDVEPAAILVEAPEARNEE